MTAFPEDSFLVGLSSIHWREAWKYGERAFRYCQHDVGHALGALRFAAAALDWKLFLLDRVRRLSPPGQWQRRRAAHGRTNRSGR
jgi:nitroreductase